MTDADADRIVDQAIERTVQTAVSIRDTETMEAYTRRIAGWAIRQYEIELAIEARENAVI